MLILSGEVALYPCRKERGTPYMTLYTSLRQMTDRAAGNADARAILHAADLCPDVEACLKNFQDTPENRRWLAEQHPDLADNVEGMA